MSTLYLRRHTLCHCSAGRRWCLATHGCSWIHLSIEAFCHLLLMLWMHPGRLRQPVRLRELHPFNNSFTFPTLRCCVQEDSPKRSSAPQHFTLRSLGPMGPATCLGINISARICRGRTLIQRTESIPGTMLLISVSGGALPKAPRESLCFGMLPGPRSYPPACTQPLLATYTFSKQSLKLKICRRAKALALCRTTICRCFGGV